MIYTLKNYGHSLTKILIPVGLAVVVGIFLVYLSSNKQLGFISGITFILVGLYPFARAWQKREFDAFEIINPFILYMLLGFGLRGLVGIKYGSYVLSNRDFNSAYFDILSFKVFIYSTIALLSLYVGYYSRLGNSWMSMVPRLNFDWQKTRVIICLITFLIISESALIVFTAKFGNWEGIESFGLNPSTIQANTVEGGFGHINTFFFFFPAVFCILCIYMFSKEKFFWGKILFLFCLIHLAVAFVHYGGKSSILNAITTFLIARHYLKKPLSAKFYVILIGGLFILSPLLWHVRGYGIHHLDILKDSYISALCNPVEFLFPIMNRSYEFDAFALFIDAIDSGSPLELGKPMAFIFYFFIPRIWWPEKPLHFSVTYLPKYAGIDSTSCMAPTLPGELYVNFHIIGVVVGFLLCGIFMKFCYQCLIKRNQNKSSLLIYIPCVLLSPFVLEGGTSKLENYLFALFPVILFLWFVKSKRKRV